MRIFKEGPFVVLFDPTIPLGERIERPGYYINEQFLREGVIEAQRAKEEGIYIVNTSLYVCSVVDVSLTDRLRILAELPQTEYPDTLEVFRALQEMDGKGFEFANRHELVQLLIRYPEIFFNRPPVLAVENPLEGKERRFAAGWAGYQILPNLSGYGDPSYQMYAQVDKYPFPTGNFRYLMREKR